MERSAAIGSITSTTGVMMTLLLSNAGISRWMPARCVCRKGIWKRSVDAPSSADVPPLSSSTSRRASHSLKMWLDSSSKPGWHGLMLSRIAHGMPPRSTARSSNETATAPSADGFCSTCAAAVRRCGSACDEARGAPFGA
eukprot:5178838-Prymnesium_polylepis.1